MDILVTAEAGASQGQISWAKNSHPCALGRGGIAAFKSEGDGITPAGRFALRNLLYRPDRQTCPITSLQITEITPDMGWSDDPADAKNYNKRIMRPYAGSHEVLWRTDAVYDFVVPLGYNDSPAIAGNGSAIFLHLARAGFLPTAGCVAVEKAVMLALLADITAQTFMTIAVV